MAELKFQTRLICLLLLSVAYSCKQSGSNKKEPETGQGSREKTLFNSLSPSETGISFSNPLEETDSANFFTYQYFYNGAGVAVGDINNDGLADLFFAGNQVSCRLYLNKGNLKFDDISVSSGTETKGWCTGVSMVDVNADGWLDIYVCRSSTFSSSEDRKNLLYLNNRNNTFTERAAEFGIDDAGFSTQAYFFDADNDNDLDMYLVNHGKVFRFQLDGMKADNAKIDPDVTHKFYLNTGQKFVDDTKRAGLLCNTFGLSASIADINGDGYMDIYSCNDYTMPDFIYINNGNATFRDETDNRLKHMSEFSMGSDAADYNNDGYYDILTLDMLPEDNYRHKMLFPAMNFDKFMFRLSNGYRQQRMQNCLQLNNGNGTFCEIGLLAGIARTDWSWASLFADFDNDGWKDLFITNGYFRDVTNLDFTLYRAEILRNAGGVENTTAALLKEMPTTKLKNYAYHNNGDLTFSNKTDSWGLTQQLLSYGAAYADLDNDGDMDLVLNNLADTASVYVNSSNELQKANYVKVKLIGPEKNKSGIGTEVTLFVRGSIQRQLMMPARGYASSVDHILNFGLNQNNSVDSLIVKWPDGKMQKVSGAKANGVLTMNYKDASSTSQLKINESPKIFSMANRKYGCNFVHKENPFIDYKREPLLPHQFSQSGPFIATGDINGDRLEDFYIGNARGSSGKMFVQNGNGTFNESNKSVWEQDKGYEDMGCVLFDSDNDNDLDLYVVSGGSEEELQNNYYQDRLYVNDGKGNFKKCNDCLPVINSSGSCVVAADFDSDGDQDLFRGTKLSPGAYPLSANSYLLRNDHGKFIDVISDLAPELGDAGMVTTAVWADFNSDRAPDLVVAGEWMPIMFFQNQNGKLVWINNNQEGLYTKGWWYSIAAQDMDLDGDVDFIAGNYGLNSKLNASIDKPLTLVAKDFDTNGMLDAIISNYAPDGKSYPIYSRDDLTDQIRPLKKSLLRFSDYAGKSVQAIFPTEDFSESTLYCFNLKSSYIENTGNNRFKFHTLPLPAQVSPVCGIVIDDFNNDTYPDVLLAGNSYAENVELGFCDAGIGVFLQGDGKGNFVHVSSIITGFMADRNVKHLAQIKIPGRNKKLILIANNDYALDIFEYANQQKMVNN